MLVLGGDGYLGWPQAMHLADAGHDVLVVDNLARRTWDKECGTAPLLEIEELDCRCGVWNTLGKKRILYTIVDLFDWDLVDELFEIEEPEVVVHFGEQRSAPFSMVDRHHAVMTQMKNVVGTLNVLYAMKKHVPYSPMVPNFTK